MTKISATMAAPATGPTTATASGQCRWRISSAANRPTMTGDIRARPRLNGLIPEPTAPRSVVRSEADVPGSTPRMAAVCVRAMKAASAALATSQPMPSQRLCFSSAIATTTAEGTMPSASGVHSPMTARPPSGTRNQPSIRADRRLRALR